VLRNHGLLVAAANIADAFLQMYTFENTCRIQLDAQAGGELVQVDPRIVSGVAEALRVQTGGLGGAFVWPSLVRKLDRMDPSYKD
jgi:ribulose-5-phosphate 4-epimerase/fuculose-1-phosphate aldolase